MGPSAIPRVIMSMARARQSWKYGIQQQLHLLPGHILERRRFYYIANQPADERHMSRHATHVRKAISGGTRSW